MNNISKFKKISFYFETENYDEIEIENHPMILDISKEEVTVMTFKDRERTRIDRIYIIDMNRVAYTEMIPESEEFDSRDWEAND